MPGGTCSFSPPLPLRLSNSLLLSLSPSPPLSSSRRCSRSRRFAPTMRDPLCRTTRAATHTHTQHTTHTHNTHTKHTHNTRRSSANCRRRWTARTRSARRSPRYGVFASERVVWFHAQTGGADQVGCPLAAPPSPALSISRVCVCPGEASCASLSIDHALAPLGIDIYRRLPIDVFVGL